MLSLCQGPALLMNAHIHHPTGLTCVLSRYFGRKVGENLERYSTYKPTLYLGIVYSGSADLYNPSFYFNHSGKFF